MAVARSELLLGHIAVAVPVFGSRREVVAALEVRLHDTHADPARVVPALTIAARALARDLGRATPPVGEAHPYRNQGSIGEE